MERVEKVKRRLDDKWHRRCYYCSHSSVAYSPEVVRCNLYNRLVDVKDLCEKWEIDEAFVKLIAFNTNLYEK